MKKEYVSPVVNSLRYMFQENIATGTTDNYEVIFSADKEIGGIFPPSTTNG